MCEMCTATLLCIPASHSSGYGKLAAATLSNVQISAVCCCRCCLMHLVSLLKSCHTACATCCSMCDVNCIIQCYCLRCVLPAAPRELFEKLSHCLRNLLHFIFTATFLVTAYGCRCCPRRPVSCLRSFRAACASCCSMSAFFMLLPAVYIAGAA
jgi:hypothetical protein